MSLESESARRNGCVAAGLLSFSDVAAGCNMLANLVKESRAEIEAGLGASVVKG